MMPSPTSPQIPKDLMMRQSFEVNGSIMTVCVEFNPRLLRQGSSHKSSWRRRTLSSDGITVHAIPPYDLANRRSGA
jgi:hypothetical protein